MSAEEPTPAGRGALAANILRFVRLLRAAGMSVGPGQTVEALRAVEAVGLRRRADFYWALHAVLVSSREQRELFDQAFDLFWQGPPSGTGGLDDILPDFEPPRSERRPRPAQRRLGEAAGRERHRRPVPAERREIDLRMVSSARERLRTKDFEQMTAEELALARVAVSRIRLDVDEITTRRWTRGRSDRIDTRATLRAALRSGHGHIPLQWRKRVRRPPALVALCDISGSMERYARMLLHFVHTVASHRKRVSAFVFGTRLTNVTRHLDHTDPDEALARMGEAVKDWSGGTRIGTALESFNLLWSRRLLGQGAVVLLITDGLDREGAVGIRREARRLRLSCRRLIWLNPLLRFRGFEPKAAGIRALLPEVDEMRPIHDLQSLDQLAEALSRPRRRAVGASTRAP